ncbi:MAG: glycine cleavage system protein GcvH [Bifidobacteriaceae bacterium]|jgi:glycine cleavage system H protein|nr:glycine cleavage system protein GcvH [Bifidobacteriaceae bacterium]
MTTIPADLSYTADHEWVSAPQGPTARVGVTEFAAAALGDVVFLELPQVGDPVTGGEQCGEIESTKSVSALFSPISGTVSAVNQAVVDAPELVNEDPFGEGWLFEVSPVSAAGELLDPEAYAGLTAAAE